MTSLPDMATNISRNSNDITDLYEISAKTHRRAKKIHRRVGQLADEVGNITTVQQRHGRRLDGIDQTLASHSQTLASHSATLASHSEKLDSHSEKLDEILRLLRRQDE